MTKRYNVFDTGYSELITPGKAKPRSWLPVSFFGRDNLNVKHDK